MRQTPSVPLLHPPSTSSGRREAYAFMLPSAALESLDHLCRPRGVTRFVALASAFRILLSRYGMRGSFDACRLAEHTPAGRVDERASGVEMLPLDVELSDDPAFLTLAARVADALERPRSDPPAGMSFVAAGLALLLEPTASGMRGTFEYAWDHHDEATVAGMAEHLNVLIAGILEAPLEPLSRLPLLSAAELGALLDEAYRKDAELCAKPPVPALFESQVRRTPHAVAVRFAAAQLTYRELDERVRALAQRLRAAGVGRGELVGVCLPRSIDVPAALLAILVAGAAYVPLDPAYPRLRLQQVLANSAPRLLLATRALAPSLSELGVEVVAVDDASSSSIPVSREVSTAASMQEVAPVASGVTPNDLAYVIYTSGSTGVPKGAMVEHGGLSNLLGWFISEFDITADDRVLVVSALGFDLTQKNLLAPLSVGAMVCLPDFDRFDPALVLRALRQHRATILNCTPSAFYSLIEAEAAEAVQSLSSLRLVVLGGEPIAPARLAEWRQGSGARTTLANTYGPTECTDICSFWKLEPGQPLPEKIPLGRSIPNARVLVLNQHLQPLPAGCAGEICIGGVGVGRGYVGDAGLTARRFVRDPFGDLDARLYRTGDFGRRLPGGDIEFLGRLDHQVKVHGNRVEIGEVEAALETHPGIRRAAVCKLEDERGERLVGYVTLRAADGVAPGELRGYLLARLPEHAVPSAFVVLDALPINPHGKVDYKALLALHASSRRDPESEPADAGEESIEAELTALWRQVLGTADVRPESDFISSGGTSFDAMRLKASIQRCFDVELGMQFLLGSGSTLRAQVCAIEDALLSELSDADIDDILGARACDEPAPQELARRA